MYQNVEASILRILSINGKTVGTGFLVTADLAVTCAHVVVGAGAIGGDSIQVQFSGKDEKLLALVEPLYWRDIHNEDVAFLRLNSAPTAIEPLRLGLASQSQSGNSFYSFGYAKAAKKQGIGARGNLITLSFDKTDLQIRVHEADQGMSGAPVFDEARGVVIGMIAKGHKEIGRNSETTFAISTESLLEVCSEVKISQDVSIYRAGQDASQGGVNVIASGINSTAVRADGQSTVIITRKSSEKSSSRPIQDEPKPIKINPNTINITANQDGAIAVDASNKSEVRLNDS